jgi:hypothetical protein
MLGWVVLSPVGASSPLRPGRVLRTNWAGSFGALALYNAHIRGRAVMFPILSGAALRFALSLRGFCLSVNMPRGGNPSGGGGEGWLAQ